MRDVVEVGWGRDKLGASVSIHVPKSTLLGLETKSSGTTVKGRESEKFNGQLVRAE